MEVKLISLTKPVDESMSVESLIAYCARVSSPNQENSNYTKLLNYCLREGHYSVFEMADMTLEITTSRAISAQILRHRSFCFQEFSQRYAKATAFETYEARRQDSKNRQNSIDDMGTASKLWFKSIQEDIHDMCEGWYNDALDLGIAKEQARMLLPMGVQTRLYMKGSVRSWIHYCQVRCEKTTQKEHRDIADECKRILLEQFPALKEVLDV